MSPFHPHLPRLCASSLLALVVSILYTLFVVYQSPPPEISLVFRMGVYLIYLGVLIDWWQQVTHAYADDESRLWAYRILSVFHPLLAGYVVFKLARRRYGVQ